MSEQSFVELLLGEPLRFPWRTSNNVRHATELRVTNNRVDIVYYEEKGNREIGFVVAVEAKIKDWRRAMQQAYRDKLFADRVYVALPEQHATSALRNLSEFRRASVGLIVLQADGAARIHHHPPVNTDTSAYHSRTVKSSLSAIAA